MFIATLFIIAKTWKQPRCPSVGEWTNILWYLQTMEYYSALKRNEPSSHKKTWRNRKCISLSERSHSEVTTCYMIPNIWHSGKGETTETVKWSVISKGWWEGEWRGGEQRTFRAEKIISMILSWWKQDIIHLSKLIEYTVLRMNPKVNYGLWVIMMCQCRFISCNKCPTLWGEVLIKG